MLLKVLRDHRPILGTFSKAIPGSVSINWSESGGENCWDGCRFYDGECFAIRLEKAYPTFRSKGKRHRILGPVEIATRALCELTSLPEPPPWVRFSVGGSFPWSPRSIPGYVEALDRLSSWLVQAIGADRVHCPIEEPRKAAAYRRIFSPWGISVIESVHNSHRWLNSPHHSSWVAGNQGDGSESCLRQARTAAAERRAATGRPCIVCPAIASKIVGTKPVHCGPGQCTRCATDDVAYPHH